MLSDNGDDSNNGGSYLPLYDNNGNVRMALGVNSSGPFIAMRDPNGVTRLVIGVAHGQPSIFFYNKKHELCFVLIPDLFIFGEDGKGQFEMRQNADGGMGANMSSKGSKAGLMFGVSSESRPIMAFMDEARCPRIGMLIDEDGTPCMHVAGKDGEDCWTPDVPPTKRRRRKVT